MNNRKKNSINKRLYNLNNLEKAYLAGFLDGDGSIITQIVRNNTFKFGFYIKISIVFYQSTKNHWFLLRLAKLCRPFGTLRKLNNGMSHFTIVAKKPVEDMLKMLLPYFILKRPLAKLVLEIIHDIKNIQTEIDFIKVCKKVDKTIEYTCSKNRKITSLVVEEQLKKTKINSPVET